MEKNIIVAVADNLAIGRDNALLWHLSEDLQYFKRITTGSPVIMGYMTYLSLGRPLPNRKNIVISLSPFDAPEGVQVVYSLDEAFTAAEGAEKCFVIGGGYTYAKAMEFADNLYITHVHTSVEDADTFFPQIDPDIWYRFSESETRKDEATGLEFEFVVYKRRIS